MNAFPKAWAIGVINKMQDYFEARFENTFKKRFGENDQQYIDRLVNTTCEILDGVTAEQIKIGLATMKTAKYCPVMPEFKNWCLGGSDNAIHASYRHKSAALANIEAWLCNDTTPITNAEKEAYNRSYEMFSQLKWNYSDRQKFHTYDAFKAFYEEVVKDFVAQGIFQQVWEKPVSIEKPKYGAVKKNYLDLIDDKKLKETEDKIKKLMEVEGLSLAEASLKIARESRKR